jgi:hypothetical protein
MLSTHENYICGHNRCKQPSTKLWFNRIVFMVIETSCQEHAYIFDNSPETWTLVAENDILVHQILRE